ncbi:nuclear transport factor 2 family protein [Nocardia nova]|uniref:nuclear transport factor 2 family protein n=1 Tax=Nocardia nova TaxID=37330 RepID=UPI0033D6ECF2
MAPTSTTSEPAGAAPGHPDAKAEFAGYFAAGLAKGNRDEFMAHFLPRVAPDVRYRQPLARRGFGHAGFRRMFDGVFAAAPDLHGVVHRWGPTEDGVLVEFTLAGTLGGRPVSIDIVDRIVLREGVMASNDTYFDPIPLLPSLLRHPILSLRLLPRFFPSATERAARLEHESAEATARR